MADEREDQPEAGAAEQDTAERSALKRSDVTEVHASPEAPEGEAAAPAAEERVEVEPPAAAEPLAGEPAAAEGAPPPQPAAAPPTGDTGTSPAAADRRAAEAEDDFSQRPELYVAAAFVAALVLGKLLKRLTRGKDD